MSGDETFEILRRTLDQGTREWKKGLGEVTIDQICREPVQGLHSIGGLILNTVAWEAWWCEQFVAGGEIEPVTARTLKLNKYFDLNSNCPPPPREPLEWYYDQLRVNRERCLLVFDDLDPMAKVRRGETYRSIQWVLTHIICRDSFNGGQVVFLKSLHESRS